MADFGSFHEYNISETDILHMFLDEVIVIVDQVNSANLSFEF